MTEQPKASCTCTGTNAGLNACASCPTPWPDIEGASRLRRDDEPDAAATEATEPDSCRPVDIDGETIRVRGSGDLSEEARVALVELVRAAKRRMKDDNPPDSWTVLRAVAFNAVGPALNERGEWLRLTTRRAIADAVLSALAEHLEPEPAAAVPRACLFARDGARTCPASDPCATCDRPKEQ